MPPKEPMKTRHFNTKYEVSIFPPYRYTSTRLMMKPRFRGTANRITLYKINSMQGYDVFMCHWIVAHVEEGGE